MSSLSQDNYQPNPQDLSEAVSIILKEQGFPVDKNRLETSLMLANRLESPVAQLEMMLQSLGVNDTPAILAAPDAAFMPLIAYHSQLGFGRIVQFEQDIWLFSQKNGMHRCYAEDFTLVVKLDIKGQAEKQKKITFASLLKQNIIEHKSIVIEAVIASFIISLLALAVSLFSMQVYDRVIPTRSEYTLIILSSGVGLVILFEAFMKFARSRVMDRMVVGMDQNLSRSIFERLLKVRIDKMPNSVGSLAAQLRGYEQVRSFFTASTLFTLVDLPMSILFLIIITVIASPIVSSIPLLAAIIGLFIGIKSRNKIDLIAQEGAQASYQKTGILVEAVEGIETIKAGSGNWKFLSRWLGVMNTTTQNDLNMRHANDNMNYSVQMLQQISYVGVVIAGSYIVMNGDMTIGGLIASTILGGRILAPIMNIPNILVQYSHAKAAQKNIENLFNLEQDNHGVSYPLSPSRIGGNFQCQNLSFNYMGNDRPALEIASLNIKAGERVAILGAIGSGKSTLLKLLSGLYAPTEGHILLDGLDMTHISRESLSDQVGYLQQDHRLFQGTLRDNLLIGMPTPTDDILNLALHRTGLIRLVSGHSDGMDLMISEGGKGLSGGQKQLVAFTRLVLTKPSVWLLDEPTASMDSHQEQQCLQVLAQELKDPTKTLVVSTHKTSLLNLVNRIIIMSDGKIVMDGPKHSVLDQLRKNEENARQQQLQAQAVVQAQQGTKQTVTATIVKTSNGESKVVSATSTPLTAINNPSSSIPSATTDSES